MGRCVPECNFRSPASRPGTSTTVRPLVDGAPAAAFERASAAKSGAGGGGSTCCLAASAALIAALILAAYTVLNR